MLPGHGFGHGSVTVLVTIRGLPQSRSITLGRPDCPELTKALSHSIIVHRTQSYYVWGDLKSLGPQGLGDGVPTDLASQHQQFTRGVQQLLHEPARDGML